jgi:hypothetical protein
MLDWDAIGDGSVYGRVVEGARGSQKVLADAPRVRQQYAQSVAYSLDSLLDFVTTYGDEKTVLVFFGDHQPSSVVVGNDASHDVPISIVAKDPAVLDRIAGWGWTDGLRPAPDAPVWPMDRFRDRFLAAYSPAGQPH